MYRSVCHGVVQLTVQIVESLRKEIKTFKKINEKGALNQLNSLNLSANFIYGRQ